MTQDNMEERFESPFEDVSVDIIQVTEMLESAGINPMYMKDPVQSRRINEIVKYFNDKDDANYVLRKLSSQMKGENPVDHIYRFTMLQQEKDNLKKKLSESEKELSFFE